MKHLLPLFLALLITPTSGCAEIIDALIDVLEDGDGVPTALTFYTYDGISLAVHGADDVLLLEFGTLANQELLLEEVEIHADVYMEDGTPVDAADYIMSCTMHTSLSTSTPEGLVSGDTFVFEGLLLEPGLSEVEVTCNLANPTPTHNVVINLRVLHGTWTVSEVDSGDLLLYLLYGDEDEAIINPELTDNPFGAYWTRVYSGGYMDVTVDHLNTPEGRDDVTPGETVYAGRWCMSPVYEPRNIESLTFVNELDARAVNYASFTWTDEAGLEHEEFAYFADSPEWGPSTARFTGVDWELFTNQCLDLNVTVNDGLIVVGGDQFAITLESSETVGLTSGSFLERDTSYAEANTFTITTP